MLFVLPALAADPTITLSWGRGIAAVNVAPPPGEHIGPESPARTELSVGSDRWIVETHGAALERAMLFPAPAPGTDVTVNLDLALCQDQGTACRTVKVDVRGVFPPGRQGRGYALSPAAPTHAAPMEDAAIEAALAAARARHETILLDFWATWCPPCNQLSAEVLEDPTNAPDLAGITVLRLDADHPSSWATKSRYSVGGYPTVILLDGEGRELDRRVGYSGEPDFLAWLTAARGTTVPLGALPAAETLAPKDALALALRLARVQQNEEAAPFLARAETAANAEDPDLHLARFLIREEPAEALWLAEHGPEATLYEWAFSAADLVSAHPELVAPLRAAIVRALPDAPLAQTGDFLYLLGELAAPADKAPWYAAAAAAVRACTTGVPEHDRGFWTPLADMLEKAGDTEGALKVLRSAVATWPEEFTYHHALAGLLLEHGGATEALPEAEAAWKYSYGDNRLRAAERLARIRAANGDTAGALTFIDGVLAEAKRPGADIQVRTTRYLKKLEDARAELGKKQ